jgi:hypothetical protein
MNTIFLLVALWFGSQENFTGNSDTWSSFHLVVTAHYDHRLFPIMENDVQVGWEYIELTVLDIRARNYTPGRWLEIDINGWSNWRTQGYSDENGGFSVRVLAGPTNRGCDCPHVAANWAMRFDPWPTIYKTGYDIGIGTGGWLGWNRIGLYVHCPSPCPELPN